NWHFSGESGRIIRGVPYSRRQLIRAWTPWFLLTACVFLWGLPQAKEWLGQPTPIERKTFDSEEQSLRVGAGRVSVKVPMLHRMIAREPPIVESRHEEKAVYEFNWLSASGTGILLSACLSAAWLGVGPGLFFQLFVRTLKRMVKPLTTIACMLAIAF